MNQKLCLITGANTGIGKAAAIQIAQQRHHVIMACRDPEKGEAALRDLREQSESGSAELMIVDMSLQSSINDLSEALLDKYDRLDVLIHNAAIFDITQKQASRTDEDIERVWATNHLGPVLLTELMWRALNNSAQGRVITIASKGLIAKPFLRVDLDDPQPLLYHNEPIWSRGEIVGDLTSGMYGHTIDTCLGMGYVNCEEGVSKEFLESNSFEIEVAGERYPARHSLTAFYDPKSERVRM